MGIAVFLALALTPTREVPLPFDPGRVAYLVETPAGFVLSNCDPMQFAGCPFDQKLFLVAKDGTLRRETPLSALGVRVPTNPVWDGEHLLLADRQTGGLLVLNAWLEKQSEVLLKGNHPYPYYPRFLAFLQSKKRLFVTGRYPLRVYLDLDCLHLHEFAGEKFEHVTSSLKTKPVREEWGFTPISWDWIVGVSPQGDVWAFQESAGKGARRLASSENWEPLDFGPYAFPPAPQPSNPEDPPAARSGQERYASGVFFLGENVLVAYFSPPQESSSVIVFSQQKKALGKVDISGRVIGQIDGLLVAANKKQQWSMVFYRLGMGK